jgi:hypothetical protein
MNGVQNSCSFGGFHESEYFCSKCGLSSIDGEDIRVHERHRSLLDRETLKENKEVIVIDDDFMINNMYIGFLNTLVKKKDVVSDDEEEEEEKGK